MSPSRGSRPPAAAATLVLVLAACGAPRGDPTTAEAWPTTASRVPSVVDGRSEGPVAPVGEIAMKPRPTSGTAAARALLPDGLPVMPGAVALPLPPSDARVVARWEVAVPGREVYQFYAEALPAAGHPITLLGPGGAAATIRFELRPGEIWQLDLYGDLERTVIELGSEER